jgi:hypothetical protein
MKINSNIHLNNVCEVSDYGLIIETNSNIYYLQILDIITKTNHTVIWNHVKGNTSMDVWGIF